MGYMFKFFPVYGVVIYRIFPLGGDRNDFTLGWVE